MANGNTQHWIYGFIATTLVSVLFFIGNGVIANETKSIDRDVTINNKVDVTIKEQQKVNEGILVTLAAMSTDLKYIKKAVDGKMSAVR